jgi:excinuclease ABC subunit A
MLLAPIARDRKGEYSETFNQLQAQGFVRFRIGGKVFEYDDLPAGEKTEKHDIDVVVDRVKIRHEEKSDEASTVSASNAIAREPSIGNVAVSSRAGATPTFGGKFRSRIALSRRPCHRLEMDTGVEHSFNAKFACPQCSLHHQRTRAPFVLVQLTRRCLSCVRWFGHQDFFDPSRVVAFPTLSLGSGAIKGWDRRNAAVLSACWRAWPTTTGFDLETPLEQLP